MELRWSRSSSEGTAGQFHAPHACRAPAPSAPSPASAAASPPAGAANCAEASAGGSKANGVASKANGVASTGGESRREPGAVTGGGGGPSSTTRPPNRGPGHPPRHSLRDSETTPDPVPLPPPGQCKQQQQQQSCGAPKRGASNGHHPAGGRGGGTSNGRSGRPPPSGRGGAVGHPHKSQQVQRRGPSPPPRGPGSPQSDRSSLKSSCTAQSANSIHRPRVTMGQLVSSREMHALYANPPPAANVSSRGYFTSCPDPRTYGHPGFQQRAKQRSPPRILTPSPAAVNERHRKRLGMDTASPEKDNEAARTA